MIKQLGLVVIAGLGLAACSTAETGVATSAAKASVVASVEKKEADRAAIMAMAGDYRVTFDFTETVAFGEGYELKPKKLSKAREVVRVIENRPDFISMQHILVVGEGDGFPVKHWRQDWAFEPAQMLAYQGANAWAQEDIAAVDRVGAWSQTVYQVDDAPRYSGVGRWVHENGASVWEAAPSLRPLPRRDATTRNDYDVIRAVNRHALTPTGWVHEQDNAKIITSEGAPKLLVHEVGINTYTKASDYPVATATSYWADTADFWAAVRGEWKALEQGETGFFGLTIEGEPEAVYMPILSLASDVREGKMTLDKAVAEAKLIIDEFTVTNRAESLLSMGGSR